MDKVKFYRGKRVKTGKNSIKFYYDQESIAEICHITASQMYHSVNNGDILMGNMESVINFVIYHTFKDKVRAAHCGIEAEEL